MVAFLQSLLREHMIRVLLAFAFGYVLLCVALYLFQERLIFLPERDGPNTVYNFGLPFSEIFIPVDGAMLHALHFPAPQAKGVVLYLHGNAGSLRTWGMVAPDLVQHGYDVLIVDYRGYGKSSGTISSESQLHRDVDAVYSYLLARYPAEQIVVYGRSLGSGLATRLAAQQPVQMLILESPFHSLADLARRQMPFAPAFLLKYPLRTYAWIGQVSSPIVMFHGRADEVVPFAASERLQAYATAPVTFIAIEGGGHNDLARFPAYHAGLAAALGSVRP
ncbi:MAG: lysophospholipase [Chloroflexales bacterium]|nr:lysophospholipase [Chloroflexales bacterium]